MKSDPKWCYRCSSGFQSAAARIDHERANPLCALHKAEWAEPQFCAEFESCTEDHCAYPGDEFCEHDRRAGRSQ